MKSRRVEDGRQTTDNRRRKADNRRRKAEKFGFCMSAFGDTIMR